MNMPGLTAEASLYRAAAHYHHKHSFGQSGGDIYPQQGTIRELCYTSLNRCLGCHRSCNASGQGTTCHLNCEDALCGNVHSFACGHVYATGQEP
jgi:hypothetical protein